MRTGRHLLTMHCIHLEDRVTSIELVEETTLLVRQWTRLVGILGSPAAPKPSFKTCPLDRIHINANVAVVQSPTALLMLTAT